MEFNFIPPSELKYPSPLVSSPLFPLLFLSLYYEPKHTPKTTTKILPEYDYIIVGAGSAGSTLASRLSEIPCISVLLLEAGKSPPLINNVPSIPFMGTDLDWNYYTSPQSYTARLHENQTVFYPLGKAIGGSSVINEMFYIRGSRHIYDQWYEQGATGWSYKDLFPYFVKMESNQNAEAIDTHFHGFHGPVTVESNELVSRSKFALNSAMEELGYRFVDPNAWEQKTGIYDFQLTTRHGRRCSVGKAYLVPAENRPNLHIVENAHVMKIIFREKQAIGVQFSVKKKVFKVSTSSEVIISAGTIHTPQILMLSGIGPREQLYNLGIPEVANLPVGMSFQDHVHALHYYYSDEMLLPRINSFPDILDFIYRGKGPIAASLLGLISSLFSARENSNSDDQIPDYEMYFFDDSSSSLGSIPNLKNEVKEMLQRYKNRTVILCMPCILRPKSRGSVRLQSSDPYAAPIVNPNYLAHPDDRASLAGALKLCDKIFNTTILKSLGFKPIDVLYPGCVNYNRNSEDYLKCEVESIVSAGSHAIGTAKMGNVHDLTTVVDPELRVKGIKGLRVVDASIMPIVPTGNTNAATITIAEKAADIIKSGIQCHY